MLRRREQARYNARMPAHRSTPLRRLLLSGRVFFIASRAAFVLGLVAVVMTWLASGSLRDRGVDVLLAGFLALVFAFLLLVYGRFYLAQRYARTRYLAALREPDPIAAIDVVEELRGTWSFGMTAAANLHTAESKALAHALYGRGAAATSELATVHWPAQPIGARAQGLWAEAVIALLCDRDGPRGLALARSAVELATRFPIARVARDNYTALVALGETCAGNDLSTAHVESTRRATVQQISMPSRLIAHLALALDAERRGDPAAVSHREVLRRLAPHCVGLRLTRADLGSPASSAPGPVSQALGTPAPHALVAPARTFLVRFAIIAIPAFCLMCAGFVLLYNFVADGH
jgi:hypothetical protein